MSIVDNARRMAGFFFVSFLLFSMQSELYGGLLGPTGHNDQRFVQLIVLTGVLLAGISSNVRRASLDLIVSIPTQYLFMLLLLFLLMVSGLYFSEFFWRGLQEVGLFSGIALMVLLVRRFAGLKVVEYVLLLTALLSSLLVLQLLLGFAVALLNPAVFLQPPMMPGFANVRVVNHLQAFLVPSLIVGYLYYCASDRGGLKCFFLSVLTLQWVLLFYLQGRGIFLSILLVAAIVLSGRCGRFSGLRQVLIVMGSMLAGLGLYWVMFVLAPEVLLPVEGIKERTWLERVDGGRLYLWTASLSSIFYFPVFGLGGQGFILLDLPKYDAGSAHNFYLNTAVEFGVPAALSLVVLTGVLGWRCALELRRFRSFGFVLVSFPLLVSLCYSLFTGMYLSPLSQLLAALYLGVSWSEKDKLSNTKFETVNSEMVYKNIVAKVLLAIWISTCSFYIAITVYDVAAKREKLIQCLGVETCFPRFWLHGDFRDFGGRLD